MNKKLICLLSYKQYYVNDKGIIKVCNCKYCSSKGECLSLENVAEIVNSCY